MTARQAVRPPRQAVGALGEDLATRYLTDRGLIVVDRNWRCALGELDIVARSEDCLVFCEVKTRRSLAVGDPVEAVNAPKVARLRRLVGLWLADHPDVRAPSVRIDVIGILLRRDEPHLVRHVVGVTRS